MQTPNNPKKTTKGTPATILALDPGLRELGYAVLAGSKLVTSGVAALKFTPRSKRLQEAQILVASWIRLYRPEVLVLEQAPAHSTAALQRVHRFAQVVEQSAKRRGIAVTTYSAQIVRKHLVGDGWASKEEVAQAIARQYPTLRVYLTQDRAWKERYWHNMFDAIALALYHQTNPPPSRSRSCG
jgi:Holliday junction resolvasome RuvABC endonuclease subunit